MLFGSIAHLRTEPKLRSDELGLFRFVGARHCNQGQSQVLQIGVCVRHGLQYSGLQQCQNAAMARVSIQTQDFDVAAELAALRAGDARVGAVCSFIGLVRDRNGGAEGSVQAMELEHYPGMTEKSIEAMIDAAMERFDIFGARVVHRVGLLQPLDQIVLVAVSSAHRGQSFQACEFLMDYLKTQAPFWKKETTPQGAHWVNARVSDDAALERWGIAGQNAV